MPTLRLMVVFASAVGLVPLVAGAPVLGNGESNSDRTFDLTEYAAFFGCLSGAGVDAGVDCADVDVDNDSDVDLADFSRFQSVFGMSPPDGMVPVPGGSFQMGDTFSEGYSAELPVHSIYLSPYYIDKYEFTNAQYAATLNWAYIQGGMITVTKGVVYKYGSETAYCDTTTSSSYSRITFDGSRFGVVVAKEDHPMLRLSWYGAVALCNWRGMTEGKPVCYDLSRWTCDFGVAGYRLPTEAEWERAARGGVSGRRFSWSNTDTIQHARANYNSSSSFSYDTSTTRGHHPEFSTGDSPHTSPVGYFAPNDYGVHDMTGNASEWCNDWYSGTYYSSSPGSNPTGPGARSYRIVRGGYWYSFPTICRSAGRDGGQPFYRTRDIGFRCALGTP